MSSMHKIWEEEGVIEEGPALPFCASSNGTNFPHRCPLDASQPDCRHTTASMRVWGEGGRGARVLGLVHLQGVAGASSYQQTAFYLQMPGLGQILAHCSRLELVHTPEQPARRTPRLQRLWGLCALKQKYHTCRLERCVFAPPPPPKTATTHPRSGNPPALCPFFQRNPARLPLLSSLPPQKAVCNGVASLKNDPLCPWCCSAISGTAVVILQLLCGAWRQNKQWVFE